MTKFELFKFNFFLKAFGFFKIPLVYAVSPKIIEVSDHKTILMLPLKRKNKNHLNGMYFGALNIGAELCIAMLAVKKIYESKKRIDFVFKDYKAQFLKRAEGDVHFVCDEAHIVVEQIQEALTNPERINRTLKAYAIVPSRSMTEKIAEFELTLSVKRRGDK